MKLLCLYLEAYCYKLIINQTEKSSPAEGLGIGRRTKTVLDVIDVAADLPFGNVQLMGDLVEG